MILDPESVGDGAGVLIEAVLESGHPLAEILGGGMAVMMGQKAFWPNRPESYGKEPDFPLKPVYGCALAAES